MNQKNQRIEPTFGPKAESVPQTNDSEMFMPVENADNNSSSDVNSVEQPTTNQESKTSFTSISSHQVPNHTFEMPLRRPDDTFKQKASYQENHNIAAENVIQNPLDEAGAVSPALQIHTAIRNEALHQQQLKQQAMANSSEIEPSSEPSLSAAVAAAAAVKMATGNAQPAQTASTNNSLNTERVIPTAPTATGGGNNQQGADNGKQKGSGLAKYRRLGLLALVLLLVGLVIMLLKPTAPSVVTENQPDEQPNGMPLEFRPLNEAEAQRAEAEEQAMREAELAQQQAAAATTEQAALGVGNGNVEPVNTAVAEPANTVVEPTPAPAVRVERPQTRTSVVHQNEPRREPAKTVERLKPAKEQPRKEVQAKPAAKTVTVVKAANESATSKAKVEAASKAANSAKTETLSTSSGGASKTMTVPKGVSLMQVFRDNGLSGNLSDVNAMLKTNNIVSNLKAGERVTVKMSNGHVAEMRISSGGRFVRQADGSYRYSK